MREAFRQARAALGGIDILVNGAGRGAVGSAGRTDHATRCGSQAIETNLSRRLLLPARGAAGDGGGAAGAAW